jgi:hypothetical protein
LLAFVRLGLWLLPFQTLRRVLSKTSQVFYQSHQGDIADIKTIVWAVDRSSYYMLGQVKCLARALTTQVLMHQYGYLGQLQIGVVKAESGELEAHAWIEYQGKVVIGNLRDLSRFTPMSSLAENQ